jgi:hypothetical protein
VVSTAVVAVLLCWLSCIPTVVAPGCTQGMFEGLTFNPDGSVATRTPDSTNNPNRVRLAGTRERL